ncbi:MAG: transposase [Anaerolineales bacterium]|nr:transposase [Anaerolineales bacterium]
MRLQIILPQVKAAELKAPELCSCKNCQGKHFQFLQAVKKPVRDTVYEAVVAHRYRCLRCGKTFRVYPMGVSRGQVSQRVKGLGVMLYLLGLSYGAVSLALEALGVYLAKSSVYEAVQALAARVPGLKQRQVFNGLKTPALGADVTSVKCQGQWLQLGLSVDDVTGLVLTVDDLSAADAVTLKSWLEPIAQAVEAEVLVTDDADGFKTVADELGLDQQVCKSHVKRNTEALLAELKPLAEQDADGSLARLGVVPQQAVADLDKLGQLIQSRQPEEVVELEQLHQRYLAASPPQPGQKASLAYRLRLLFLDRWNLWPRLTFYRTWQGPQGQTLDGTNNGSERAIGWWIKERYRTMRGYKRPQSALNVSRLLAWTGNHLGRGGADFGLLLA